jgi:hypothetical protein
MVFYLNGKEVTYSSDTIFYVQVGRGKGSYKARYSGSDLSRISFYYTGINVGNGYKKRLLMGNKVLVRQFS